MPDRALSDFTVLGLTHDIVGSYCTKLLANFSADKHFLA